MPVRDDAGQFVGVSDLRTIAIAAVTAATQGRTDRAEQALSLAEGVPDVQIGAARAVVDLVAGRGESAERIVRELAQSIDVFQTETAVNETGYVLMRNQQAELALQLFEINTRVFPDASNTWDSLGEAHMTLGNENEAIRAYEKSLELDPDNENARTMIARIRGGGGF